jgi:hypothetical protein
MARIADALAGAAAVLLLQRIRQHPRSQSAPTPAGDRAEQPSADGDSTQADLDRQLTKAVEQRDVKKVRALAAQGARPIVLDSETDAVLPIHTLCRPPSAPNCTAEDAADTCEMIAIISSLEGFDPNARSQDTGRSALHYAARNCDATVVRCIAALPGLDPVVCALDNSKDSHAHLAIYGNNAHVNEILSALVEMEGFNADRRCDDGCNLMNVAIQSLGDDKAAEVIRILGKYTSEDCLYEWDRFGQTALYWATCKRYNKSAQAILDIERFSFTEQVRRLRHPETGQHEAVERWPLVTAIDQNVHAVIRKIAEHLRAREQATPAILAEVFDTELECMPAGKSGTLMQKAVTMGALESIVELYLAGATTSIYDLLPALVGPTSVPRLADECCALVRAHFLSDFAEGDVSVESVEPNTSCPSGLIGVFRSALDVFKAKHGGRQSATRFLWHSSSVPQTVMEAGLNGNYASMDLNVYGVGLYMATDAKLSAHYAAPDEDGVCTMLLVLTMLGRTGVREPLIGVEEESLDESILKESMAEMGINLTQPQHRNPPVGCDSATGPHEKEVVAYSSAATLPAFVVRFKMLNKKMPNPYSADTASRGGAAAATARAAGRWLGKTSKGSGAALKLAAQATTKTGSGAYLRALRDVPLLLTAGGGGGGGGGGSSSGLSVEGELEIDEDARLLPMGTFPTSRAGAVELRRKVQSEGFSAADTVTMSSSKETLWAKVGSLNKEIEWLKASLGELQQVRAENMALKVAVS